MKKMVMFFTMVVAVAGLCACGGGGSGATATPVGTPVNLTAFKGVLMGTAAGTHYSFPNLTGTDSQGRAWTGSFSLIADGATTFESQNVTVCRALISLQLGTGTPFSSVGTRYFQVADGSIYKNIDSFGLISVPASQTAVPDILKVGDSGTIATFNNSDGTTLTATWSLIADINGASRLVITSVTRSGSTITDSETDTYYLDTAGNPTKFAVIVTSNGVTLNLSGNRV
jgi:hypothetical protein